MKKTLLFGALTLLTSCAVKIIPLQGTYQDKPFITTVDMPIEQVWDKVIDFFAQNGLPIKIIDRSSGLIISETTRMTWTFETKDGKLEDPSAWVVLEKNIDPGNRKAIRPDVVTASWNIRLKEAGSGKTDINVNLVNIDGKATVFNTVKSIQGGVSTGNFEALLTSLLNVR